MSINFSKLEHKIDESSDDSSDSAVLSGKSEDKFMSTPDPDLPKPPSEGEKVESEMLKTMLELYRENFKKLPSFDATENLSLDELRALKARLDSHIVAGPIVNAYEEMFWMAIKTVEKMAIKANYDLSGWAQACASDENIVLDVRYIIINYVGRLRIRPELRLAMNMMKKAYIVQTINESKKPVPQQHNNPVDNITNSFSDVKPTENLIKDSPIPPNISIEINK